jgi:hypothetical protein
MSLTLIILSMPTLKKLKEKPRVKTSSNAKERAKFYKSKQWVNLRLCKLQNEPLCELCKLAGRITPATDVHHIKGILERPDLSLDYSNL